MKIVNIDGYSTNPGDLSWEQFKKYGDFVVYDRTEPDEIYERIKDADCIFMNKSILTNEMLDNFSFPPLYSMHGLRNTLAKIFDTPSTFR